MAPKKHKKNTWDEDSEIMQPRSQEMKSVFMFQGKPPEKFSFVDSEWVSWFRIFERYRSVSKLASESDETQVNTLILSMGPKAETIIDSFNMSDDDLKVYSVVVERFSKYFSKKTNIIYERAKFNNRYQNDNESVSDFITSLFELSKSCNYSILREELVRDRIVVGIKDKKLSLSLQLDSKLTLESVINKVKQSESVQAQQPFIRQNASLNDEFSTMVVSKQSKGGHCYRCGSAKSHNWKECQAKEAICFKCKNKGHFANMCKSKNSKSLQEVSETVGQANYETNKDQYLQTESVVLTSLTVQKLNTRTGFIPPIEATIYVNRIQIIFKIDTGADITCVPLSILSQLSKSYKDLKPFIGSIEHAGNGILSCVGTFEGEMKTASGRSSIQTIYVIEDLKNALLGRPAIHSLNLLKLSDEVGQVFDCTLVEEAAEFKSLFLETPGVMTGGSHHIKLVTNAKPFAVSVPRRVPLPLFEKVREELLCMECNGIISKVEEATEWCAPIVVATKKSGSIRICGDFTELNRFIVRERLILPSTEEIFSKLSNAKVFSKLDARMGFWQIQLSEECKRLTTFITPFGRYCYNRMPFGISSAPEHYQRRVAKVLEGLQGCVNMMDDILIWGNSVQEHDARLELVLQNLRVANITLNHEKCEFRKTSIKFLGHEISENGVSVDPDKVKSITNFQTPSTKAELQRYLGMFTYLTKFVPKATEIAQPLRELLKKDVDFQWNPMQEDSFLKTKHLISKSPVLKTFDVNAPSRVSADASSFALGGLLEQEHEGKFYPVMYISRALTPTETNYAQIEREALACTWACERLGMYLIGKRFLLQTDHKPLVSLLGLKPIQELSPRLLRFRLRLLRFDYDISYVPGKLITVPDALSRQINLEPDKVDGICCYELEEEITEHLANHPVRDTLHELIREHSSKDEVFQLLKTYIHSGWNSIDSRCSEFSKYKESLALHQGMIMMGNRIVVPRSLRELILNKIHEGHLGISKCRGIAKETVWWPRITYDIERKVTDCIVCIQNRRNPTSPLLPTDFPKLPWSVVGADLFAFDKKNYLVVQDYFSRYLEIVGPLSTITSRIIIASLKKIFSRFGVPHRLRCDNGTQLCSEEIKSFAKIMGFEIVTSSPKYPRSNGLAESAVETAKKILSKCEDMDYGLLSYRSAPLENGYSPAELLMGRRVRSTVPITMENLRPAVPDQEGLQAKEKRYRMGMKRRFDQRHGVSKELPELVPGDQVWLSDIRKKGTVISKLPEPRSYLVKLESGAQLRRNRAHLTPFISR